MKKMTKIEALKATLVKLNDNNAHYDWMSMYRCQMGWLVQVILDVDSQRLHDITRKELPDFGGFWAGHINEIGYPMCDKICSISGMPMNYIFSKLIETGFNYSDIAGLERLNSLNVLERAGRTLENGEKEDVITYIAAWIELLEAENPPVAKRDMKPESFEPVVEYVTVEVDSKVKELVSTKSLEIQVN